MIKDTTLNILSREESILDFKLGTIFFTFSCNIFERPISQPVTFEFETCLNPTTLLKKTSSNNVSLRFVRD